MRLVIAQNLLTNEIYAIWRIDLGTVRSGNSKKTMKKEKPKIQPFFDYFYHFLIFALYFHV